MGSEQTAAQLESAKAQLEQKQKLYEYTFAERQRLEQQVDEKKRRLYHLYNDILEREKKIGELEEVKRIQEVEERQEEEESRQRELQKRLEQQQPQRQPQQQRSQESDQLRQPLSQSQSHSQEESYARRHAPQHHDENRLPPNQQQQVRQQQPQRHVDDGPNVVTSFGGHGEENQTLTMHSDEEIPDPTSQNSQPTEEQDRTAPNNSGNFFERRRPPTRTGRTSVDQHSNSISTSASAASSPPNSESKSSLQRNSSISSTNRSSQSGRCGIAIAPLELIVTPTKRTHRNPNSRTSSNTNTTCDGNSNATNHAAKSISKDPSTPFAPPQPQPPQRRGIEAFFPKQTQNTHTSAVSCSDQDHSTQYSHSAEAAPAAVPVATPIPQYLSDASVVSELPPPASIRSPAATSASASLSMTTTASAHRQIRATARASKSRARSPSPQIQEDRKPSQRSLEDRKPSAIQPRRETCQWDDTVDFLLKKNFRLKEFRESQRAIIDATLSQRDVFVVMRTGGGKSLTYQLPALLEARCQIETPPLRYQTKPPPQVTFVVSPLLSLIHDQVEQMNQFAPNSAISFTSDLKGGAAEHTRRWNLIRDPTKSVCLVFVTPERIVASNRLQRELQKLHDANRLGRFVIDECHCASQWGHDFRPDYTKLGILRQQFRDVPILAVTATASEEVRQDVTKILQLAPNHKFIRTTANRPNLTYSIRSKDGSAKATIEDMVSFIKKHHNKEAGIIYTHSKKDANNVSDKLNDYGISAEAYHSDVAADDKAFIHSSWMKNETQVVVATIAFGLGINKPDVRFVLHHSISKTLEGYYQESGRAGRDGLPADCVLYYSPKDITKMISMISNNTNAERNRNLFWKMAKYAQNCGDDELCRATILNHLKDANGARVRRAQDRNPNVETRQIGSHVQTVVRLLYTKQEEGSPLTLVMLVQKWRAKPANADPLVQRNPPNKDLTTTECERIVAALLIKGVFKTKVVTNKHGSIVYLECQEDSIDYLHFMSAENPSFSMQLPKKEYLASMQSASASPKVARRRTTKAAKVSGRRAKKTTAAKKKPARRKKAAPKKRRASSSSTSSSKRTPAKRARRTSVPTKRAAPAKAAAAAASKKPTAKPSHAPATEVIDIESSSDDDDDDSDQFEDDKRMQDLLMFNNESDSDGDYSDDGQDDDDDDDDHDYGGIGCKIDENNNDDGDVDDEILSVSSVQQVAASPTSQRRRRSPRKPRAETLTVDGEESISDNDSGIEIVD